MKHLEITLRVPIVDLPESERRELAEQMMLEPDDTLENLAEYIEAPDGADRVAQAISSGLDLADKGEMFAGSEIYVTMPEWPHCDTEVVSAKWVA